MAEQKAWFLILYNQCNVQLPQVWAKGMGKLRSVRGLIVKFAWGGGNL